MLRPQLALPLLLASILTMALGCGSDSDSSSCNPNNPRDTDIGEPCTESDSVNLSFSVTEVDSSTVRLAWDSSASCAYSLSIEVNSNTVFGTSDACGTELVAGGNCFDLVAITPTGDDLAIESDCS